MLKRFMTNLYAAAVRHNEDNILGFVANAQGRFIDIGCGDGSFTEKLIRVGGFIEPKGIELNPEGVKSSIKRGISTVSADLTAPWPFMDEAFDVVHSNQVVEHVPDVDFYLSESRRILSPGGTLIISTENGSSWHNIFASVMGWQTFSSTNLSQRTGGLGNPLALLRGRPNLGPGMSHKIIFNYRGLIEILQIHGFEVRSIKGAGYYPFPTALARLDVRHSHFLTVEARKA